MTRIVLITGANKGIGYETAPGLAAAAWIDSAYGRLDVLVNDAGISGGGGSGLPSETTLQTMRTVYETNVFGVVTITSAMLPLPRRSPAGRIVNVSSDLGSIGPALDPGYEFHKLALLAYASSKSALNMVTACYAKERADAGIK